MKFVYLPVESPNGKTGGGFSNTPSDPTARSAMKAIQIQEKLEARLKEQSELGCEIEEWLLTVTDPEIEAIIRFHYILGFSWKGTNIKVFGDPNYHRARKKIFRFFGKE